MFSMFFWQESSSSLSLGLVAPAMSVSLLFSQVEKGGILNTQLVVSNHWKNISQNGSSPQIGVKIKMVETTTYR